MKTLIIYYSQHGSTEVVARTLAKELRTDILCLLYTSDAADE